MRHGLTASIFKPDRASCLVHRLTCCCRALPRRHCLLRLKGTCSVQGRPEKPTTPSDRALALTWGDMLPVAWAWVRFILSDTTTHNSQQASNTEALYAGSCASGAPPAELQMSQGVRSPECYLVPVFRRHVVACCSIVATPRVICPVTGKRKAEDLEGAPDCVCGAGPCIQHFSSKPQTEGRPFWRCPVQVWPCQDAAQNPGLSSRAAAWAGHAQSSTLTLRSGVTQAPSVAICAHHWRSTTVPATS